ncbi:hydroxysqualene dehydroxylase HpnE [Neisseria sp. ZJ106]|uniref:Hydroxysqualene dehydroxylase HpnE n=1 Tax=Neisseria lisongii TaxID=2912188 RepID=A0ABY7RK48_9NEIS|nr:hydroxysqualene dehydroxylase HpnE [Neisseria lisongii]MCF7521073.1 hydroxysqualene dehydroxylase HpnE [Neisseria lisongii]WCL72002.1 hydroxysqualene dehydroxylase HpnE [Neisseria lisongii]
MNHISRPKIAVIGAGWAGLSAAVTLAEHADISLFEAGRQAGGRARTLTGEQHGFSFLDNGQHILIGAYRSTLALLQKIGVRETDAFLRQPLQWHISDGLQFQTASPLPKPWHILSGILRAENTPLRLKLKLLADMHALQRRRSDQADINVAHWLAQRRTPRLLISQFWQPLVLGALNTPLHTASLRLLARVLQDSINAAKSDSDYLLPKQDLSSIAVRPALNYLKRHGCGIHLATRVAKLEPQANGTVGVDGRIFDAVILATAPYHAAALLPSDTPPEIQTAYAQTAYHAITTVYLRYPQAVKLPAAMTGLADGTAHWLIERGALGLPPNEIAAVISVSEQYPFSRQEWAQKVHADIQRLFPHIGEPQAVQVITEKRATAAASVHRPNYDTAWLKHRNIYPAGDYLHPYYPATLEAAVQSGMRAAELCLNDLYNTMPSENERSEFLRS